MTEHVDFTRDFAKICWFHRVSHEEMTRVTVVWVVVSREVFPSQKADHQTMGWWVGWYHLRGCKHVTRKIWIWLVVKPPLWKISVNWDDYSLIYGKIKWQPNHQPGMFTIWTKYGSILNSFRWDLPWNIGNNSQSPSETNAILSKLVFSKCPRSTDHIFTNHFFFLND